MNTATIYVAGTFKRSENKGYFGYSISKNEKNESNFKFLECTCHSKIELQLSAMIKSLQSLNQTKNWEDLTIITDFSAINNFLDGTVLDWELNQWARDKDKPLLCAELWEKLSNLSLEYNIRFILADNKDEKLSHIYKKLRSFERNKKQSNIKRKSNTKTTDKHKEITNTIATKKTISAPDSPAFQKEKEDTISQSTISHRLQTAITPSHEVVELIGPKAPANIKVDEALKQQCEDLFQEIGLDLDVAVTMFLKDSLRKQGLSLDLKLK